MNSCPHCRKEIAPNILQGFLNKHQEFGGMIAEQENGTWAMGTTRGQFVGFASTAEEARQVFKSHNLEILVIDLIDNRKKEDAKVETEKEENT